MSTFLFPIALTPQMVLLVAIGVFLASFVDGIAGGGGIISVPAYLLAGLPAHLALGTNKLSSAIGTSVSTDRFIRNGYVDWKLAELIVNIQYACQRHYFGAMAENYFDNKLKDASVNVQRRQKTYEAFDRLPEEFTIEDVVRCFNLGSAASARKKVTRLCRDHLIEKISEEKGGQKALFQKTGNIML